MIQRSSGFPLLPLLIQYTLLRQLHHGLGINRYLHADAAQPLPYFSTTSLLLSLSCRPTSSSTCLLDFSGDAMVSLGHLPPGTKPAPPLSADLRKPSKLAVQLTENRSLSSFSFSWSPPPVDSSGTSRGPELSWWLSWLKARDVLHLERHYHPGEPCSGPLPEGPSQRARSPLGY